MLIAYMIINLIKLPSFYMRDRSLSGFLNFSFPMPKTLSQYLVHDILIHPWKSISDDNHNIFISSLW